MQQRISVTGSSRINTDLDLEDDVVLVVVGTCSQEGVSLQQAAGRVPFRKVRINDIMMLDGTEARDMRARVLAENNDADLRVINGDGADQDAG